MFVITPAELEKRGRIRFPADKSFRSARYLTADDTMGFSYNENSVANGTDLIVWLKHHWEANYILSGEGEVTDLTNGRTWPLEPGVLYVVGPNDRHRLQFTKDERHLSIFWPPLRGNERFDEDGSYEASGPTPKTDRRMFVRHVNEMEAADQVTTSTNGQIRITHMLTEEVDTGFVLSEMRVCAGSEVRLSSERHHQANHVIGGSGDLTDISTGQTWELMPSMAYCVGPNDHYRLFASEALQILSISASAKNQ